MNRKILTLFLLLIALSTIAIVSAADTQKLVMWNLMSLKDTHMMLIQ
ncbi:MAG: hypothetical protein Q4Q18_02510 [Methanobrevibacter sp.]|nr:hypothetical protein [Methanobrevibacter sp.]